MSTKRNYRMTSPWLFSLCMAAGLFSTAGSALAQALTPAQSSQQFQQVVRQQQVSDQLQKSQLQSQLHQDVSDMAKQPYAQGSATRQQQKQADQARQARDNASQQDLINKYRDASSLPTAPPPTQGH